MNTPIERVDPTAGAPPVDGGFDDAQRTLTALRELLGRVVVGQDALVEQLVTAVFAGGHVLIEGLPGLGKTHLVKALAAALGLRWARVQCTPDLMPADVTGAEIYVATPGGGAGFEFRRGPVFAQLVLVDEINRATPRTQAALLEAMQERQVTHAGIAHPLPRPFTVVATQNPIELEGTYPLPEAQLDRFMFKLSMPFPSRAAMHAVLETSLDGEPADAVEPMADAQAVQRVAALAREVLVGQRCRDAAVDLVLATQPLDTAAASRAPGDDLRRHVRYGASPRALQSLVRAARVRALMAGRPHVDIEDLAEVALPVLRHRVLLRLDSELEGVSTDALVEEVLHAWRARA